MMQFTPDAKQILDDYLQQVRLCVSTSEKADPEEVVRDVAEHVEGELRDAQQPVAPADLEPVLQQLGDPKQWISDDDVGWWGRMVKRLHTRPEDWRLAYLSLGVLIFGTILAGPLGLLGSFCLSRAAVAISAHESPPAKKWLIYPSLLIVYGLIAVIVFLLPAWYFGQAAEELFGRGGPLQRHRRLFGHDEVGEFLAICSAVVVALGTLGVLIARRGAVHLAELPLRARDLGSRSPLGEHRV